VRQPYSGRKTGRPTRKKTKAWASSDRANVLGLMGLAQLVWRVAADVAFRLLGGILASLLEVIFHFLKRKAGCQSAALLLVVVSLSVALLTLLFVVLTLGLAGAW